MAKIYSYQKKSDAYTTYTAQGDKDNPLTELCTIDGITYISATETLPKQPEQVVLEEVTLTDELRTAIKQASPHVKLIAERMEAKIRERYSLSDEQYFARIGVGSALSTYVFQPAEEEELRTFGAFVESMRQWGRDQRAELGL